MAAKYLVTTSPGAPVPGVGFVRIHSAFTAPEGYMPSRTFKPLNDEASAELAKLQVELRRRASDLRARKEPEFSPEEVRAGIQFAKVLEGQAKGIDTGVVSLPKEEKKIEVNVVEDVSDVMTKKAASKDSRKL